MTAFTGTPEETRRGRGVRRPRNLRVVHALVCGAILTLVGVPTVAGADPAGPTDYESDVVSIEPAVDGLDVQILGGDAFVQLTAPPGAEILVTGYEGEPFLDFTPQGIVRENQLSPSKFVSQDRYGQTAIPPNATADAQPAWSKVSDSPTWVWHDHRTHLMSGQPLGAQRGDQVAEGVIPLQVDGQDVRVTVQTVWVAQPSPIPWIVAAVLAAIGVAALCWKARSKATVAAVGLAILAAGVGLSDYLTLPSEARSSAAVWVLPLVSVAMLVYGAVRGGGTRLVATGLAGIQLTSWGYGRIDQLNKAILPTDLPFWLERVVTIAVLIGGGGVIAAVLLSVVAMMRGAERPTAPGGQTTDGTAPVTA
jgi:hypothetical protein